MPLNNKVGNVIEKIVQWHGMGPAPEPNEALEAAQLIPLAPGQPPLPGKLTGVKHVLKPGDIVTISGDSREYLVAMRPLPHNQLQRTAKKNWSRTPANTNSSPGDPNTDGEMDADMGASVGARGGSSSSFPAPSQPTTSNTTHQITGNSALHNASGAAASASAPAPGQGEQEIGPAPTVVFGSSAPYHHSPRDGSAGPTQPVLPAIQTGPPVSALAPRLDAAGRDALNAASSNSQFGKWMAMQALLKSREGTLKELSKAALANLEAVPRDSVDYVQVMLHLGAMDVVSVRMMRNEAIDTAFAVALSGAVGDYRLIKVLHGTNVDAIDAIVREGFKVGGEEVEMRNGNSSGTGVYLTTKVATAAGFSKSSNSNYLMLCELCVDQKCIAKRSVYVQPNKALVRPLFVVEFRQPKPKLKN